MDRVIVYPSQLPAAEDFLTVQRETQRGLARLISAITGNDTAVDGIAVTPTTPASMAVSVTGGTLYTLGVMDGSAFGILPAEISGAMRAGGFAGATIPLAAPQGAGTEVVYLIQTSFSEVDVDPAVLDYYNAANPNQPWSGPGNSGQQQFTRRSARAVVGVKAGAVAPAGQAQPPAADPGWFPLWTVRVSAGATSIGADRIAAHPQSPRFRSRLTNALTAADIAGLATQAALAGESQARASGDASVNNRVTAEVAALNAFIAGHINSLAAADANLNEVLVHLRDVQLQGYITQFQTMFQRFPGGMIMQGGRGVLPASGQTTSSTYTPFPIAFPNGCVFVVATIGGPDPDGIGISSNSAQGWNPSIAASSLSHAGFIASADNLSPGTGTNVPFDKGVAFNFIAFGW